MRELMMGRMTVMIPGLSVLTAAAVLFFPACSRAQGGQDISMFNQEVSYTSDKLRDPFKNPIVQLERSPQSDTGTSEEAVETLPPSLKIQGIFWGGKFPQAIVNGKIVKVGEMIDGARIVSIDKNSVSVFFVNKQYKISSPALSPASSNASDPSQQDKKGGI